MSGSLDPNPLSAFEDILHEKDKLTIMHNAILQSIIEECLQDAEALWNEKLLCDADAIIMKTAMARVNETSVLRLKK